MRNTEYAPEVAVPMALPLRCELKIPLQYKQFAAFMPSLYQLGFHPKKAYPDRVVHTIYFDTPDLENYRDNVAGISRRSKTRLRWYDDDPARLALEFKVKNNKKSTKQSILLKSTATPPPRTRAGLRALIKDNSHIFPVRLLSTLSPVMEVQYERRYFTLGEDLRMTVDQKQQFKKLYPYEKGRFMRSPVDVVIELKFPAEQETAMKRMLTGLPFRIFRHSKYVVGIDVTCG